MRFHVMLNNLSGNVYKLVMENDEGKMKPQHWHIVRKETYGEEVKITIRRKSFYHGWSRSQVTNKIVATPSRVGNGDDRIRERRINSDFDQIKNLDKAAKSMHERCDAMMDEIHEFIDKQIKLKNYEKGQVADLHKHFPNATYPRENATSCSYNVGKHTFGIHAKGRGKFTIRIDPSREYSAEHVQKLLAVFSGFEEDLAFERKRNGE